MLVHSVHHVPYSALFADRCGTFVGQKPERAEGRGCTIRSAIGVTLVSVAARGSVTPCVPPTVVA